MIEKIVNDNVTLMLTEIAWYQAADMYDEDQCRVAIDSLTEFAMFGLKADLTDSIYDILTDVGVDLHDLCRRRLHVRFNEILPSQIAKAKQYDEMMAKRAEKANVE